MIRRKICTRATQTAAGCLALLMMSGIAFAQVASTQNSNPNNKKDVYLELTKAPQKAVERQNPLEHDPDAIMAGGKLYELHCMECHGDTAAGGKKGPSLRVPQVQQATPGTLFWLLTNGVVRRGMPVWSKLPEPQRWQLVSYIRFLNPASKAAPSAGVAERRRVFCWL